MSEVAVGFSVAHHSVLKTHSASHPPHSPSLSLAIASWGFLCSGLELPLLSLVILSSHVVCKTILLLRTPVLVV